jgi:hypothetical protein
MSGDIYRVEVLEVGEQNVVLRLVIKDAESGNLPAGKPWALMLAGEAFHEGSVKNRAGAAATAAMRGDASAFIANAEKYIAGVELVETKNYPIENERRYNAGELFARAESAAWGEYVITFVDPAWTRGWKAGQSWDSTSFAPYEPAPPVEVAARTDARTSYYFVGTSAKLTPEQRQALVDASGGVVATAIDTALDYLVIAKGTPSDHPDIVTARRVAGSCGLSFMTEAEFVKQAKARAKQAKAE